MCLCVYLQCTTWTIALCLSTASASQAIQHTQEYKTFNASPQDRSDFWSRMPFLMALAQYHESLPDSQQGRKQLVESVAYRFFMQVEERPSPKVKTPVVKIMLDKHQEFMGPWATESLGHPKNPHTPKAAMKR